MGLARHALFMVSEMFADFIPFWDPKVPKRLDGDFLGILQCILELVNTKYLPVEVYDDLNYFYMLSTVCFDASSC